MATLLSLPVDIVLKIIYSLHPHGHISTLDLRALFATCKTINSVMATRRCEIVEYCTVMIENNGTTTYWLAGQMHRAGDSPALIETSSHKRRIHANSHELGSYRMIHKTERRWYQYGKLHRRNGPAVVRNDGQWERSTWYLNGVRQKKDVVCLL